MIVIQRSDFPLFLSLFSPSFFVCLAFSDALLFCSSRPGRPPKRGPVGLSLPPTHMSSGHLSQLKKLRLEGDYPYENGHMNGE